MGNYGAGDRDRLRSHLLLGFAGREHETTEAYYNGGNERPGFREGDKKIPWTFEKAD